MNDLERDLLVLKDKMTILASNKAVRRLLAEVVYNQSEETFSIAESQKRITKEIVAIENDFNQCKILNASEDLKNHCDLRIASDLIGNVLVYLQTLFCSPRFGERGYDTLIRDRWLFENLIRLKKWLIVAKILGEHRLSSFKNDDGTNITPTPADTPTHIMELWIEATLFEKERQSEIRRQYMSRVANNVSMDFLTLGYGSYNHKQQREATEFVQKYGTKKAIQNE